MGFGAAPQRLRPLPCAPPFLASLLRTRPVATVRLRRFRAFARSRGRRPLLWSLVLRSSTPCCVARRARPAFFGRRSSRGSRRDRSLGLRVACRPVACGALRPAPGLRPGRGPLVFDCAAGWSRVSPSAVRGTVAALPAAPGLRACALRRGARRARSSGPLVFDCRSRWSCVSPSAPSSGLRVSGSVRSLPCASPLPVSCRCLRAAVAAWCWVRLRRASACRLAGRASRAPFSAAAGGFSAAAGASPLPRGLLRCRGGFSAAAGGLLRFAGLAPLRGVPVSGFLVPSGLFWLRLLRLSACRLPFRPLFRRLLLLRGLRRSAVRRLFCWRPFLAALAAPFGLPLAFPAAFPAAALASRSSPLRCSPPFLPVAPRNCAPRRCDCRQSCEWRIANKARPKKRKKTTRAATATRAKNTNSFFGNYGGRAPIPPLFIYDSDVSTHRPAHKSA